MAVFELENEERFDRLDWNILAYGGMQLYRKQAVLDADLRWLAAHEYQVYQFRCEDWSSAGCAMRDIRRVLGLPNPDGVSLDALGDFLEEMSVPLAGGVALALRNYDRFDRLERGFSRAFLDLIANAARQFALVGRHVVTLIQSDDPGIRFEGVGPVLVRWNPEEWFLSDRE